MKAFDRDLNRVILELAPRHIARPLAPIFGTDTPAHALQELVTGGGLLIWDGASEQTIYADPKVNHAFRAWHDHCHLISGAGFTLDAERVACETQISQLLLAYPRAPRRWIGLIRAEVIGQAEHFARTGAFPANQFDFMKEYLG